MQREIRIATRGSKLAVYQAERVKEQIEQNFPGIKTTIKIIHTRGDKVLDISLSKIGDKGLFTKELEHALIRDHADIAVHSLKDLPTEISPGLTIGGVLERGEIRDALISARVLSFKDISPELRIATSSLRRRAQLMLQVPGINVTDIRGNVDTRIRKMKEGECDAIVMAAVGLQRLGLEEYIRELLDTDVMIPAVGQGAIAMQIRRNDKYIEEITEKINHKPTLISTHAERIFLRRLEGGCQIPIGCYTTVRNNTITLTGFVSDIDGNHAIKLSVTGPLNDADQLAKELAEDFIKEGAGKIIAKIRQIANA